MASIFDSLPFATDVFGKKPQVAQFTPIDYGKEQAGAIQSNISAFPAITALGSDYTQYSLDALNKLIPGYSGILASGGKDTSQLLDLAGQFMTGEIPPDVLGQIERSDAFTALSGGYAGSQMSHALTARDLGLTSIDLMKTGAAMLGQGGNSAQTWAGLASGSIMNPASQMITPQQKAQFDLQNALLKLGTKQELYNVNAAPDPAAAAFHNTIMGILGMYMGGGMGGLGQAGQTSFGSSSAGGGLGSGGGYGGGGMMAGGWSGI